MARLQLQRLGFAVRRHDAAGDGVAGFIDGQSDDAGVLLDGGVGIVSVLALHETARKPLKGSPPCVGFALGSACRDARCAQAAEMDDRMPEATARARSVGRR